MVLNISNPFKIYDQFEANNDIHRKQTSQSTKQIHIDENDTMATI